MYSHVFFSSRHSCVPLFFYVILAHPFFLPSFSRISAGIPQNKIRHSRTQSGNLEKAAHYFLKFLEITEIKDFEDDGAGVGVRG